MGERVDIKALRDICLANLQQAARSTSVRRVIARQHKQHGYALVPVLTLGSEEDMQTLWERATALDPRVSGLSFSADDPEDVRRLEATLDGISLEVIDQLRDRVRTLFPNVSLTHGLIDGHWIISVVIPPRARLASPEPQQVSLWEGEL